MSHDVNEDGVINNSDFSTLLDFVVNGIDLDEQADINFDSFVDVHDLIILADFLQQGN